jgi:NADPH:quinone reductase
MAEVLPETMRAVSYSRYGSARDVLEYGRLPTPHPGPGEVLVKLVASGVNPHDVKKRSGWLDAAKPSEHVIPHIDGAGLVIAGGDALTTQRVDERVFVFGAGHDRPGEGTAAEYVAIASQNAVELPDDFSFSEGAAMGVPTLTAYFAVLGDGPVTGQHVLVQGGAGAVGSVAIEFARWNCACVTATVSSPAKAEIARNAGADHIIDYSREDVATRVLEITKGTGFDRIVEVDFGANVQLDAACLKPNGTIASYSSTKVREPVLPYYRFALKGARINLLQAGNMPERVCADGLTVITALMRRGRLRPRIAAAFPLAKTFEAQDLLETGSAIGNIVVEI